MRSPRLDQLSDRTAAPSTPRAGDGFPGLVNDSVQAEYVPAPRSATNASVALSGEIASAERHENRRVVCGIGAMRSRGSKSEIGRGIAPMLARRARLVRPRRAVVAAGDAIRLEADLHPSGLRTGVRGAAVALREPLDVDAALVGHDLGEPPDELRVPPHVLGVDQEQRHRVVAARMPEPVPRLGA